MRLATTREVCLDAGKTSVFCALSRGNGRFDHLPRTTSAIHRCSTRSKGDPRRTITRNRGNVVLDGESPDARSLE